MAIEKEYILKVSTDGGKKNVDSLNKSLGKTEANQKKIASSTKKVSKATKVLLIVLKEMQQPLKR